MPSLFFRRNPRNLRRSSTVGGFVHARDGATAVEFAILAAPLLGVLLAILQTTVVFLATQVLETATEASARQVLTGSAQKAAMTQKQFAAVVCSKLPAMFTCGNVMIDMRTTSTFASADTSSPTLTRDSNKNVNNAWQYQLGNPGDIVTLRVMYVWPVIGGPLGMNLSNQGDGTRLMIATSVFKTEQYQ